MRELRNLINELQDYIKRVEDYVFKNNKSQYYSLHNQLTKISDVIADIDYTLININTPDKISSTIKLLEDKRKEVDDILKSKNIKIDTNDYEQMLLLLDKGPNTDKTKLTITEEQINNLLSKLDDTSFFKEQINNLPSANASEIPGLNTNNKFTSDVRL